MGETYRDDDVTIIGEGKWLRLLDHKMWEYVERKIGRGVIVIIAVTDDDHLVLVEQYRPALRKRIIELPAGLVGDNHGADDESFETAGNRELIEETGYSADRWAYISEGPGSCGISSEIVTFYEASGLTKVGEGGGVDNEDIVVHTVPLTEIDNWIDMRVGEGLLVDPKLYVGIHHVLRQRAGG
jgi:ADP-ribose pyrophosphatase